MQASNNGLKYSTEVKSQQGPVHGLSESVMGGREWGREGWKVGESETDTDTVLRQCPLSSSSASSVACCRLCSVLLTAGEL